MPSIGGSPRSASLARTSASPRVPARSQMMEPAAQVDQVEAVPARRDLDRAEADRAAVGAGHGGAGGGRGRDPLRPRRRDHRDEPARGLGAPEVDGGSAEQGHGPAVGSPGDGHRIEHRRRGRQAVRGRAACTAPGPAGQTRRPMWSWASRRPSASKASEVGRSVGWSGPPPRIPRPPRPRGDSPRTGGLVSGAAGFRAGAARLSAGRRRRTAIGIVAPASGHRPFCQVQTPPSQPPTARIPSGPKASDEVRASKPLSWVRAAESWMVQIGVNSARPAAASVRPSGEKARSKACSEPGSAATRLAAAGSQSSIRPPAARASVPVGLKRISRVKLRPGLRLVGKGRRLSVS